MSASRRRAEVQRLLRSPEPSVRWRTRVRVLGEEPADLRASRLEEQVRTSPRARRLLTHQASPLRDGTSRGIYHYWQGLHWALASLADIGYPAHDPALEPALNRTLAYWTQERYDRLLPDDGTGSTIARDGVVVIRGRPRRCASIHGNALLYASRLGVNDARTRHLADLIVRWQWPDGGWNCDRDPAARVSSFMETLLTMRGLAAYAAVRRSSGARAAARRASEVFLSRRLFRRARDGKVMRPDFLRFHYPLYWHYDVLGGLKGLAEVGGLGDARCSEALDWLESRELPTGGWPADRRYYRVSGSFEGSCEYVDWGAPRRTRSNPWVTTDALYVLREAGRFAA